MKILIPTDFSKLSKIAIQYALDLSKDIELELVLLNVVNYDVTSRARIGSRKLHEAVKTSSERDMTNLLESIHKGNDYNTKIDYKIIHSSSIVKEVELFATTNEIDMIFIGTKGATGLNKILLGSNAASIIEHSSIPVLTIPENAQYKGIHHMVYPSDLHNLNHELKSIIPFAKLFDSLVHIIHIQKDYNVNVEDLQSRLMTLKTTHSYEKIELKSLNNPSVLEGINQYVLDINADMLTMFTHHTNVIEKLFNRSITQNTAYQTTTPLLTFQKELRP